MDAGSIAGLIVGIVLLVLAIAIVAFIVRLRKVVPTNRVHIVQSNGATTSYGKDRAAGNAYYRWPSFLPRVGVSVIELPVSNFEIPLEAYDAYDKDRVPFVVDVAAFFQIHDTDMAAQRVDSMDDLKRQMSTIVQGAVRKVLASSVIDDIMTQRSTLGEAFTAEVERELRNEWGIKLVKNMELMDIRDAEGSKVIENIMAKKTSEIARESRIAVANNNQAAKEAELQAQQAVDLRHEEVEQAVGKRKAEREQEVGIANELSLQQVLEKRVGTTQRDMQVKEIERTREAEITSKSAIIKASQDRKTREEIAEGELKAKQLEAEGVKAEGTAQAEAAKAMQMAPVEAQVALAKEIGSNENYQQYLATTKALETYLSVGTEQARALQGADVKVIANSDNTSNGMRSVMNLFSSQGGTQIAAMLEALTNSEQGNNLLASLRDGVIAKDNSDVTNNTNSERRV